jgi:light-regulated signal transduction histidine kinase (bacteriophytochrome)
MQELVTGLLEYTRIGNQRSLVKIDCNTLVSDVLGDLALALEQSNASLQIGKLPELLGYPSELRQLFQNLISNALKFVPAGRRPEVIITAKNAGGYWEFSVQDNGIGIDPKHFEKIFVLFKRLHNRSDYDGTGIGLAHCKKIVQLHSGEIHVESEVERGSTFCFTINKNLYNERDFE